MAIVMDGKAVAQQIKDEVKDVIEYYSEWHSRPSLAIVTIGEDDASKVYVRNKLAAAAEVGIKAKHFHFTKEDYFADNFVEEVYWEIGDRFDTMILQLPVPEWVDKDLLISLILPEKDVDGLTETNIGQLQQGSFCLEPCTPKGIIELLDNYVSIESLKGKHAVIINRSLLVGKPLAAMLLRADMTVTICHSHTEDLSKFTKDADLLITAAGVPGLITADMVKDGAIVIDVSINRNSAGKLCGDVDFENVEPKCSYITPVPGGVGPMTVAMLMKNVYLAVKNDWQYDKGE